MKILYGVPSEGMGHATRSKVVIEYLLKQNHDVQIVSSDRAFLYLQNHFGKRVHQIEGFHLAYKKAIVSVGATVLANLKSLPRQVSTNFKRYQEILSDFHPEYIISDFESFTDFYARLHRIPCVSIDNMQVIDRALLDIEIPRQERGNHLLAKQIIKNKVGSAKHYLITSFFFPEIRKKHTEFVYPIIRKEIIDAKPADDEHIVVYQTSSTQDDLIERLQTLPRERFLVYGFNKEESHGNVQLKKFSETTFVEHFATAKAVLSNGGFSFLSEAVYLKKPTYSVPIQNQFEQFVNASYINKLGYGMMAQQFDPQAIKAFLYDLPSYRESLRSNTHDHNQTLFARLDQILQAKEK